MADLDCFCTLSQGFEFSEVHIADDPRGGSISFVEFKIGIDRITAFFRTADEALAFSRNRRVRLVDQREKV